MPDLTQYFPVTNPTIEFFVVLCIILLAPIVMGKLRIPHIIGMVLAGVLFGEYGLNILVRDESFELFGRVGLLYIMFLAGLEMDLESIRKNKRELTIFGLLTFAIPFLMTIGCIGPLLGYSTIASLLLGCIMSSNTLVAYPIVSRFGLQQHRSVTISVGGTMIALFLSLVFIAAIAGAYTGGGGVGYWLLFAGKLVAYCVGLTMLLPRLTRWFLRRYSDAVMQFIFILAELFISAVLSEAIGLEGIFGAFLSGLILSRYIPRVSPLMNRLEFIGNALFIPYFLIGVGMLIDISLLFQGGGIVWVVLLFVFVGTCGKGIAAYLASIIGRMPLSSGHMMFGLTSAHAAGAIAMIMVGRRLEVAPGEYLVSADMLNGVIIMILFTCIISSMVTERTARRLILADKQASPTHQADDEKILICVKYPEIAGGLLSVAAMMRNTRLNRGMVALNVVYDDQKRQQEQEKGRLLLASIEKQAVNYGVRLQTHVRIAANIANGIKHAFKEYDASEIVMGVHVHKEQAKSFWGTFAQSLYNGLERQITLVRLRQPLNTLRRIQVAIPSRAEFEPGFYRWLERLARLSGNLDCRIIFHGRADVQDLIADYLKIRHPHVRAEYREMKHWNELPRLARSIPDDHLLVVITARKGSISYKNALEKLPDELDDNYSGKNLMMIFPDQYGDRMNDLTFAEPQHHEEKSAYQSLIEMLKRQKSQE